MKNPYDGGSTFVMNHVDSAEDVAVRDADYALNWIDSLVLDKTGHRLSDLQRVILQQVWQGRKYFDIAVDYGCTEGHAKDVGAQLWKSLSEILGEKITKQNCRSVTERCLNKARSFKRKLNNKLNHKLEQWGKGSAPDRSFPVTHDLSDDVTMIEAVQDASFVGREGAIAHLSYLFDEGHPLIVIQGEGGLGKTTLAQQFFAHQAVEVVLELVIANDPANITPVEQVVNEWLKQDLGDEPGTDFGIALSRLKRHLRSRPMGVFIDNLEPTLDANGCFIEPHRNYGELFRVLGDRRVQSITLVTSRDRLCEPGLTPTHYRLPSLELPAWSASFAYRQLDVCADTLREMHRAYGGNAKAMGLLSGVIQEDFAGDMRAYWQLHKNDLLMAPDLRNLVSSQVDRLQTLDKDAYRLFCRMGGYRYQTIPYIPTEGILALLWDVPTERQHRVLTALKHRSLLECQHGTYSLHPAVQTEAIARLRHQPDWERTHREAAQFWTHRITCINTRQDALQALEAYYHYMAIDDVAAAGQVILKSRVNQWNQFLPLGSTLYRFGLVHSVFDAVAQVTQRLEAQQVKTPQLGELYNIWGDMHWIQGRVHAAIACQQQTISLATQQLQAPSHPQSEDILSTEQSACSDADPVTDPVNGLQRKTPHRDPSHRLYYLKMLAIDSSLSLGLYNIDLWELDIAAAQFEQVIKQAQQTRHHSWAEKATVCLALVRSYQGRRSPALELTNQVCDALLNAPNDSVGRAAYFLQVLGCAYENIGESDQATLLLTRALTAAEAGHYLQIQGRTHTGLGAIARQRHQFKTAIAHHTTAIQLLESIGAACDLAEAHVQLGLTYQHLEPDENCQVHYERAIALFQSMNAPRQLERISTLRNQHPTLI
ncbi:MAG: NB-ARC domain-containing protein [Leptolyngbyaceae bacterium]|nr:NB-ARC domain-containing protein [Leptolyngbyaceae bacterium]